MRNCVLAEKSRLLLRGAAVVVIAGMAAGCSADMSRFTYRDFTGSVSKPQLARKLPNPQPFPSEAISAENQDGVDPFDAPAVPSTVTRGVLAPVATAGTAVAAATKRVTAPVVNAAKALTAPLSPARQTVTPVDLAANEETAPDGLQPKPLKRKLLPAAPALDNESTGAVAPKVRKIELKRQAVPLSVSEESDALPKLKKPAAAPAGETVDKGGWTKEGGTQITVREGETLYNYSKRFGVPVASLLKANGLTDASQVKAGQKLIVPAFRYSQNSEVSAPDANFDTAAARSSSGTVYDVPKEKVPLPKKQPLRENVAVLPAAPQNKQKTAPASQAAADAKTTPKTDRLKIKEAAPKADQAGNHVEGAPPPVEVAEARVTPKKLAEVKAEPGKKPQPISGDYAVADGDSLYKIARKHGVSVAALKEANGLADGKLKIGQALNIPAAGTDVAGLPKVDPIQTGAAGQAAKLAKPVTALEAKAAKPDAPKNDAVTAEADQDESAAPNGTGISKLRWPVRGRTVTGYGQRDANGVNDGIDISAPEGTPIKAAENGVVIYAGDGLKEFGNTVLVRHADGIVTVYGHASALKVKRGQKIKRGEELATTGMSGNAKAPMLHFEVRKNSAPVNPASYLE